MRTLLFLTVGFLLLAACFLLGRLFSAHYPNAMATVTVAFMCLWLLISGFNLWVGVSKAGYSLADEQPIFFLVFVVPAAVALLVKWRFF
jgi:hypothetical protein